MLLWGSLCSWHLRAQDVELSDGQDSPGGQTTIPTESGPTVSQDGSGRQVFDAVFAEWREQLKALRDLQHQFSIAEEGELDAIRDEYLAQRDEAGNTLSRLRTAAIAAYREQPETDRELTRFLVTLVTDDVGRDRYEQAYETASVLIDNDTSIKAVLDPAAVAAFALHKFEQAEKWTVMAEQAEVLEQAAENQPYLDDIEVDWQREQELRAAEGEADNLPRVLLKTSKGEILLELFENEAPDTVGNFISLVESGFYEGLTFHRVLRGFMAQGGCPRGDGTGGPGYQIYCECFREDHRKHFRGTLSMAKSPARDTGGSQFFITFAPAPHLDGKHTVFGRVLEGFDVLELLNRRDPDKPKEANVEPDFIVSAKVVRKRDHAYRPNRVQ